MSTPRCALIGGPGAGQLTKMVNQLCIAGIAQSLAEALAFAKRNDLDLEKVVSVISKGAAQTWQMDNRWKAMSEMKVEGFGFAIEWMRKDMNICLDQARRSGARLPVAALVDQFWAHLEARVRVGTAPLPLFSYFSKTNSRLFAGIALSSASEKPARFASASIFSASRSPLAGSRARSMASKRALLSDVCFPP